MLAAIGHIEALYRYPVKSMAGESLQSADLGFHGIAGDRRFAFRRLHDRSGFPWLTASKFSDLLRYTPVRRDGETPTHVRTPDTRELPICSEELAEEISQRYGSPVEMLQLRYGIFDDAAISVIALDTIHEISRLAGVEPEVRRFRPNVAVRLSQPRAFQEDTWLGGTLTFGDSPDSPTISVTVRDVRCGVINLDPETAQPNPALLKTVVRTNQTCAGIYATVTRPGTLVVGQPIFLRQSS